MVNKRRPISRLPIRHSVLGFFLKQGDHRSLAGDFEEIYSEIAREKGAATAAIWFWSQILRSIPACIHQSIFWSLHMFKNYFKVALRNMKRHKGYSIINITGLAIGMACCLLISLWVFDELSYDRFHESADRIYRVEFDQNYSGKLFHVNVNPYPLARALETEIPEVEEAARYTDLGEMLFQSGQNTFYEDRVGAVDPSFLTMFSFPLLRGDRTSALNEPMSLVITQKTAEKYFGSDDPIGKTLTVNTRHEFMVTGILKDVPQNSTFRFNVLISYRFLEKMGIARDNWQDNNVPTYVKLSEIAQIPQITAKIQELNAKYKNVEDLTFSLMPLKRIHLYNRSGFDSGPRASQFVYIFSVIAFFVLLIACINFMNLSTARSAKRAKEVGIRKVVGAYRTEIVRQFYGESLMFTLISLLLALVIVIAILPHFNAVAGKSLSLNLVTAWQLLLGLVGVALFTGWIAGSYPALFLGSFQPVSTLKGKLRSGPKNARFRRVLVVVQFSLSISLIIGTGVVFDQLNFLKTKKLGYEKEHTIYIPLRGEKISLYPQLKSELERHPGLLGVSGAEDRPSMINSNTDGSEWEGKDPELSVSTYFIRVDYDFFKTMGIELDAGRSFSREFSTDTESAFIINQELARVMGFASAVDKSFSLWDREGSVIGVVKDFHFLSLKKNIEPLVIILRPQSIRYMLIRLNSRDISASLAAIEKTWERVVKNFPFEFRFLNEDFDALYKGEERMGDILKYFASLAIFIACLGLLGLASFAAEQRTKEIGVRKVLGATSAQITWLIYKEFITLLVFANLTAWPVSYVIMHGWLQDFAYRTGMNVVIFALAALAAVVSAFLTVSYQALKASQANPIKALRYE